MQKSVCIKYYAKSFRHVFIDIEDTICSMKTDINNNVREFSIIDPLFCSIIQRRMIQITLSRLLRQTNSNVLILILSQLMNFSRT